MTLAWMAVRGQPSTGCRVCTPLVSLPPTHGPRHAWAPLRLAWRAKRYVAVVQRSGCEPPSDARRPCCARQAPPRKSSHGNRCSLQPHMLQRQAEYSCPRRTCEWCGDDRLIASESATSNSLRAGARASLAGSHSRCSDCPPAGQIRRPSRGRAATRSCISVASSWRYHPRRWTST